MNASGNFFIQQGKALLLDLISEMCVNKKRFIRAFKKDPDVLYAKLATIYFLMNRMADMTMEKGERKNE